MSMRGSAAQRQILSRSSAGRRAKLRASDESCADDVHEDSVVTLEVAEGVAEGLGEMEALSSPGPVASDRTSPCSDRSMMIPAWSCPW